MKKKILALVLAVTMIAAAFAIYSIADKAPAIEDQLVLDLDSEDRAQGIFYTLDENAKTATVGKAVYAEHNTSGYEGDGTVIIPDIVKKGDDSYIVREVGRNAFDGSDVKEVIILNSVVRIGEMAFAGCENLERVAMGTGVTEIAGFAFWHCSKLVDASLGENVKTIGGCAFWSCESLEVITIPQGATTIMEKAFADCSKLADVFKADATEAAENAFEGTSENFGIISSYIPTICVPTVYAEEGETITYRLLLEGNPGGVAIPNEFKLNDVDRTLDENGGIEIGTSAYNGTIFTFTEPVTAEAKTMQVDYNGTYASGSINACDHADTKEVVTTAATCTEKGAKDIVCTKCLKVLDTDEIDALGHDYIDFVIEAVCLDGGYTTHKCSRCGDLYKDAETEPTGHHYDEGSIHSMPTFSATGVKKFVCETCKRVNTVYIPMVGDLNGDGKRNSRDVIDMMNYILGVREFKYTFHLETANCNGAREADGSIKINSRDLINLMKSVVDPTFVLPATPIN